MNIVMDPFRDRILLRRPGTKKEAPFSVDIELDFPLDSFDAQIRAAVELFKRPEAEDLKKDPRNSLILSDVGIGFGTFELPALSRFKMKDVFTTKFKASFPSFGDYYVSEQEYERNSNGCIYFFSFARKEGIEKVLNVFKTNGVSVGTVDHFASAYAAGMNPNNPFPVATLIVGNNNSELIVSKGKMVLAIYEFGYGYRLLMNGENYLDSAYNSNNDKAKQFAAFANENFAKKIAFSDENIAKADPNKGLSFSKPKEIRVMKDEVLANYQIKSNIRKFYAAVVDTVSHFTESPWFLPLHEVYIAAPADLQEKLEEASKEETGIEFVDLPLHILEPLAEANVSNNRLFKSGVQKERRGFDWKKFLTLEIGGKKKA